MANEGSGEISPFSMLLTAQRDMNEELKQHRVRERQEPVAWAWNDALGCMHAHCGSRRPVWVDGECSDAKRAETSLRPLYAAPPVSDIKQNIADQRQMHASLVASINNLAESIDRHEHIFEKVLSIESWRSSAKLEERMGALEAWKIAVDLQHANWKGRAVIGVAIVTMLVSIAAYIGDKLLAYFLK